MKWKIFIYFAFLAFFLSPITSFAQDAAYPTDIRGKVATPVKVWSGTAWVDPPTGNGVTGVTSPRVTVSSDNTPFPVKIDQTTPGTTNRVDIGAALPTGANTIGTVNVGTFPDNEPINIGQYGGVAVGASNAVHVQSGTGASFTVDQATPANLQMTTTRSLTSAITHNQVSVAVTATLIVAANTARKSVVVKNQGSADVFIGASAVTTTNGLSLSAGQVITFANTSAAIYGIVASGTQTASYIEE